MSQQSCVAAPASSAATAAAASAADADAAAAAAAPVASASASRASSSAARALAAFKAGAHPEPKEHARSVVSTALRRVWGASGMRVRNQRPTLRRPTLLRSDGPRPEARPTQGAGGETLPASIELSGSAVGRSDTRAAVTSDALGSCRRGRCQLRLRLRG